jgi:hypothetical protein
MWVATFMGPGVEMFSVASAVSDMVISGPSVVAVPAATAVRATSSGGGVQVP